MKDQIGHKTGALIRASIGAAVVLALGLPAAPNPAQAAPQRDPNGVASAHASKSPSTQTSEVNARVLDPGMYWTKERLAKAIPADVPHRRTSSTAVSTTTVSTARGTASRPIRPKGRKDRSIARHAKVPITTGKLFFTSQGIDYVCSAAVVNGRSKNLISTAAHCVHEGPGGDWHYNIAFAPAYRKGLSRYGLWYWRNAFTFNGWIYSGDYAYDQAFVSLYPRGGKRLVDRLGGFGLRYGYSGNQKKVRVWGWPAEYPYSGEYGRRCDGTARQSYRGGDARLHCHFNGGASGGPWLLRRSSYDAKYRLGFVFAVTSRRRTYEPTILAVPYHSATKSLFDYSTNWSNQS